jgi:uncharacterized Ntn-hydrolase superfamily protein
VTYSIVAFDSASGQLGVAVASCVPLDVVQRVPGEVSGRGAYVTQSYLFDGSQPRARDTLMKGATAEQTLAALIDPAFDADFELRQYAVIDVDGGTAQFTGRDALAHAAHRTNRLGSIVYAVQGNVLVGEATLANVEAGFLGDACDLPARLVRALETAGLDGGGDSRCAFRGHPAQAAVVRVPSVGLALDADVGSSTTDPAASIRVQLEAWRKTHPCAKAAEGGDGGCRVNASSSSALSPLLLLVPLVVAAAIRSRAARRRVP